jgi:RNA polymerase sigma factor (TIGR02999 family)
VPEPPADITRLLREAEEGRPGADDRLMQAVYEDLRRVAQRHLDGVYGRGQPGVTLEPAALVNESFLRLIRQRKGFDNRGQFFAIATRLMLRVLVDDQRRRRAQRRGGARQRVTLDLDRHASAEPAARGSGDTIAVDVLAEALERLESIDPRKADVVKFRVVWGMQMREVAESLGISLATAERDWAFAKAWLAREAARPEPE